LIWIKFSAHKIKLLHRKRVFMKESRDYLVNMYTELDDMTYDFRNTNLARLVISKIKGKHVLDIGCGSGLLLSLLKKKGISALGIEPNERLIQLARRMDPGIDIIQEKAENINRITDKFDTITMVDVLEHIQEDKNQLRKAHALLETGENIILVVPALKFLYGKRDINNGHYRRYSKKEIVAKLEDSGFKVIQSRYWNLLGFFPYFFYEKVLKKEFNTKLRTKNQKNYLARLFSKALNAWFKHIENPIDFHFGLSLICVARKDG
jgi:SAM-dependent methyltransferase